MDNMDNNNNLSCEGANPPGIYTCSTGDRSNSMTSSGIGWEPISTEQIQSLYNSGRDGARCVSDGRDRPLTYEEIRNRSITRDPEDINRGTMLARERQPQCGATRPIVHPAVESLEINSCSSVRESGAVPDSPVGIRSESGRIGGYSMEYHDMAEKIITPRVVTKNGNFINEGRVFNFKQ